MKISIGDIIEIETSIGLSYALFTHNYEKPPKYGALLRVFSGKYDGRPDNLNELLKNPVQFSTFFPLHAACKKGLVSVAGHVEIPDQLARFPLFRANGLRNPITHKVTKFFIWDGEKSWPVKVLTPEEQRYPVKSIINDTLLKERIEAGWTPENDFK